MTILPMDLKGATALVIGLGRSGRAAARLALKRGARVIGTDTRDAQALRAPLAEIQGEWFCGGHENVPWQDATLIIVSPGVPPLQELALAVERGVPVVSELEFASQQLSAPVVAIGGTNGKSTTTMLVAELLQRAGLAVFSGGNLGTPLSELLLDDERVVSSQHAVTNSRTVPGAGEKRAADVAVVEVSSFQLERSPTFRPRVSALLNISEDHLDRYPTFQSYANAKGNAFTAQTQDDVAIVPVGDAACLSQARRGGGSVVTFGKGGAYEVQSGALHVRARGAVQQAPLTKLALHGAHNLLNLSAAVACVDAFLELSDKRGEDWIAQSERLTVFCEAASAFQPLAHRMTRVRERSGVCYYDDSKATNVGAAVTAIRGLAEPKCVLIAGGRDKHGSYDELVAALRDRGRAVVLIGEAADRLAEAISEATPIARASGMEAAVRIAADLDQSVDAVLLSPACSSLDMFSSYAERGVRFNDAVNGL